MSDSIISKLFLSDYIIWNSNMYYYYYTVIQYVAISHCIYPLDFGHLGSSQVLFSVVLLYVVLLRCLVLVFYFFYILLLMRIYRSDSYVLKIHNDVIGCVYVCFINCIQYTESYFNFNIDNFSTQKQSGVIYLIVYIHLISSFSLNLYY